MGSLSVVLVIFLLLFFCLEIDGFLRVRVAVDDFSENFGNDGKESEEMIGKGPELSYAVVNERNETLFDGGDLAVFVDGRWCVAPSKDLGSNSRSRSLDSATNRTNDYSSSSSLVLLNKEIINGTTPGLGRYDGLRIRWSCDTTRHNKDEPGDESSSRSTTTIITSFLNFESRRAVLFDIEYPDGAENTSLFHFNRTDGNTATLATFPSFVMKKQITRPRKNGVESTRREMSLGMNTNSYFPPTFPSALSWQGSFVQSVRGLSVGLEGGPTVFYNASDPTLENVVVVSPFVNSLFQGKNCSPSHQCHHYTEFTAGNNKDWTGTIPSYSPGRSGRLTKIPPGSSQSILLYQGSKGGITSTIAEWGSIMQVASTPDLPSEFNQKSSMKSPYRGASTNDNKVKDVTLERIGYQTDNGAMYCFCSHSNCSQVLLEEKAYLDSIGIPIGYLSFQGAGTSSGRGKAAPWCVEKWSADGGQDPSIYPLDTKVFQEALGVPLQLYAPYFCPNSTGYFLPDSPWQRVSSNPELPGCSDFAFETVRPSDSKAFFEWFLYKGKQNGGMISFESDFMNQNVNCVGDFVQNPNHGADFLEGMATAALGVGVTIQWCYASPTVVMASLDFPAVTNFRVSFDFCYGRSYEIGESSLLVWATGAAPSKDTLWTTDNNHTETPGCSWTVDHETVAAELHVVLAIMSTGPVGISDAIGMTNATLLQRIISKDGSLLQPSKPITAVDSSFLDDSKPDGFLYGTHGLGISWIFVSFQLRTPFPVTLRDFWPPPNRAPADASDTTIRFVHRTFASSPKCLDGADAISSGCVTLVSFPRDEANNRGEYALPPIFVAPPSSFAFPGSDLSPSVTTVWQECTQTGIFFLGELDKYVALSPKRFQSLVCTEQGVSATIQGSTSEVVEVTILIPHAMWYEVVQENITVSDPATLAHFEYRTNNQGRDVGIVKNKSIIDR